GCSITGNTISGFTIGILEDSDGPAYSIRDNVVTSCSSIGIAIGGRDSPGDISRNLVERCGIGISVGSPGLVQDNVVLDCSGEGMRLGFYGGPGAGFTATRNIIGRGGSDGVHLTRRPGSDFPAIDL